MKKIPEGHALVRIEDLADLHRRANLPRPRGRVVIKGKTNGLVYFDCVVGIVDTFDLVDVPPGGFVVRVEVT